MIINLLLSGCLYINFAFIVIFADLVQKSSIVSLDMHPQWMARVPAGKKTWKTNAETTAGEGGGCKNVKYSSRKNADSYVNAQAMAWTMGRKTPGWKTQQCRFSFYRCWGFVRRVSAAEKWGNNREMKKWNLFNLLKIY